MDLSPFKKRIRAHYDQMALERHRWREKNAYYHETLLSYVKQLIPKGKKIIVLGCGNGELLSALEPLHGVGIDISGSMIDLASQTNPGLEFIEADAEDSSAWNTETKTFDFIVMPSLVGYLEDIQSTMENMHALCHSDTKLVIVCHNFMWEPILKFGEKFHLKMPQMTRNWVSLEDIENLLYLADFETINKERTLIVPKKVPLFYKFFEVLGGLPYVNRLCLLNFLVAKPADRQTVKEQTVSIIIPCKNERENIRPAIQRLPEFGRRREVIFVEGGSRDGTLDEIQRVIQDFPDRDIKCLVQKENGKADAVWLGFEKAYGEILMILDGDLTVAPEDLPRFYRAIASGKGEFINGSRLVYAVEDDAMRTLNMLGNKVFSLLFTWLLGQRIKDTLCGTKVLSRSDYLRIASERDFFRKSDPFGDFCLLFGASRLKLKIVEIPVRYHTRRYGRTQIDRIRHGFLLLKMCLVAVLKWKFT
jgi:SAM-dependent methyltransferase